jgi:hypothetical protein
MKIKCPGCASLLEVPDSSAGQVVKCKCGKQLRAPAAKGSPSTPARPAPTRPAPTRPAPGRPAASVPPAASGLFDELTDSDLSPIKAVHVPGQKEAVKAPGASAAKLLDEAISGSDRRGKVKLKGAVKLHPALYLVALGNIAWAVAYVLVLLLLFKVVKSIPGIDDRVPNTSNGNATMASVAIGVLLALSVAAIVGCFLRHKAGWYILLFTFAWGFGSRVTGIIVAAITDGAEINYITVIIGLVAGGAIWAYMHTKAIRGYFKAEDDAIWKRIAVDVAGVLMSVGFGFGFGETLLKLM